MKNNDGGPAFPLVLQEKDEEGRVSPVIQVGMSLLDYFAGQALVGISSHKEDFDNVVETARAAGDNVSVVLAQIAYYRAEAMIDEKQRLKE